MQNDIKRSQGDKPEASNIKNKKKVICRGDVEMINQVFNSVEKSERAIKKTRQSIDETMKFIKELEEKEKYSSTRKYYSGN